MVDNGICIVDSCGVIEYMNVVFEIFCGWLVEVLLGVSYGCLFCWFDGCELVLCVLCLSLVCGGLLLMCLYYLCLDGCELWCDVVVKVLCGELG